MEGWHARAAILLTLPHNVLLSFRLFVPPSFCPSAWHLHTWAKGSGRQKKTFFPLTYFHHLLQFNIQVRKQMETSPVVLANGDRNSCL